MPGGRLCTIYQLTADKLGMPPTECVFADDTAGIAEISRLLGPSCPGSAGKAGVDTAR
jgi:hypothetical protein